jgi:hypothetical protein
MAQTTMPETAHHLWRDLTSPWHRLVKLRQHRNLLAGNPENAGVRVKCQSKTPATEGRWGKGAEGAD